MGTAMTGLEDAAVVAGCRDGDPEAWNELVERFSRYVHAILVQGFRLPAHDAEDVFQDVFARVWTHLDRLRDDGAIRPWIAQTTRRLAVDRLRAGAREQAMEVLPEAGDDDPALTRLDAALDVHRAMAVLTEHCREILDRFYARDESYEAIGAALDIPPGTIASRISRCLSKLRREMEGR